MELERLIRSLNRIENYVAKHIYKKYIEDIDSNSDSNDIQIDNSSNTENEENKDDDINSSGEDIETIPEVKIKQYKFKYNRKPKDSKKFKRYIKSIFDIERKSIITQQEYLKEDLAKMHIADNDYELDPKHFKISEHESYPDEIRCCYIRNHKNKLIRCQNKVSKNDDNLCHLHIDNINMFWNKYQLLLKNINK